MINFRPHSGISGWTRTAWKVSHSEAKPFSGGKPAIAAHPVRNASDVRGMRWIKPPMVSMSRSPVASSTAPAPKNSRLLKTVWFSA